MDSNDLHWLAGLLEGEGCFAAPSPSAPYYPRIMLRMCDEDIVRRAAAVMGGNAVHKKSSTKSGWNDIYYTTVSGQTAVSLMHVLFPLMGARRQRAILAAVAAVPQSYPDPCKVCHGPIPYDGKPGGRRSYCSDDCRVEGKRTLNKIYDRKRRSLTGAGYNE